MKRSSIQIGFLLPAALMLAAALLALSACQKVLETVQEGDGTEICLSVSTEASPDTKTAIVNSDADIQDGDIIIYAYFHSTNTIYLGDGTVRLKYDGDNSLWYFDDGHGNPLHYYWPIVGSYYTAPDPDVPATLDFIGYWPATTLGYITSFGKSGSGVQITCSNLPGTVSPQEFLYVCMPNKSSTDQTGAAGGKLPLVLNHPFAKVNFQVVRSRIELTLSSVVVSGFKNSGSFLSTANPQWSSLSGSQSFSMTSISHTYTGGYSFPDAIGGPFLAIPQSGTLTFTINASWPGWSPASQEIVKNVDFTWEPGRSYTYSLDLDTINFNVTVESWGTNTDYPLNY